jgi:hypothetical protein
VIVSFHGEKESGRGCSGAQRRKSDGEELDPEATQ